MAHCLIDKQCQGHHATKMETPYNPNTLKQEMGATLVRVKYNPFKDNDKNNDKCLRN